MPKDLPGFYYDAEKNRYFPIKGPIPGSSRNSSSSSATAQKPISKPHQENTLSRRIGIKAARLLQARELYGNVITFSKGKCNFQEEYQKIQASQPMVWKYHETERISDGGLEQIHVDINMPNGLIGTEILVAGGINGSLSLQEVGNIGQQFDFGEKFMPDKVGPINIEKQTSYLPGHLWRPSGASVQMSSNISCVKMLGKQSTGGSQHVLITTLGAETSGGSVYILDLSEPLDCSPDVNTIRRRINEITSFSCTIWSSDCNYDGSRAVIGTNLGAALVNMDIGISSWILRCKSDVTSLQLDHSGNIVVCGLRNGAILTVDSRQKPEASSARLTRHQIPYPSQGNNEPSGRSARNYSKKWFELKGNLCPCRKIFMPSSVSCLASLRLYDQYFLASSMDGSIKLYDNRLIRRGAVQSYQGNVNSHTRIQLGVDPSERTLMSGGEDCNLRLWDIKSGKLLFEDKFMNSVPSVVCWPRTEGLPGGKNLRENSRDYLYGPNHSSGAWVGSQEGLFYMNWNTAIYLYSMKD